jgi:hypothetical protein
LAREAVAEILGSGCSAPVTGQIMDQAAEALLERRDGHVGWLLERLKEPRVIQILEPVLAGTGPILTENPDDQPYCLDLGLVVPDRSGNLRPANALYAEAMSRLLAEQISDV